VTFTAEDDCDNALVQTARFIVLDTLAPQIIEPVRDSIVYCGISDIDGTLNTWITNNAGSVISDACSNISWTNDYDGLGAPAVPCDSDTTNRLTVTFTAEDDCSNTIVQTARFIVIDTIPPVFVDTARDTIVECVGVGPDNLDALSVWLANNGGATAIEGCNNSLSSLIWSHNYDGNGIPLVDPCNSDTTNMLTVVFSAADECGNQISTSARFIIIDSTNPGFDVEASDLIIDCDGAGNVDQINAWLNSNGGAIARDNCTQTNSLEWSNNYTSLTSQCGATGTTLVTFTGRDACGNERTTQANLTIRDIDPPTLDATASNASFECDGSGNSAQFTDWLANNGGAAATDLCSTVVWSNSVGAWSDDCAETGTVSVVFTAIDACSNTVQTTATFTIVDSSEPVFNNPPGDITVDCGTNIPAITPAVDDLCDNTVAVVLAENITNGNCVDNYTIQRTWTATDACNNSAVHTQIITVQDTTRPVMSNVPLDLDLACDETPPAPPIIIATDNCDPNVTVSFAETSTSSVTDCSSPYVITRTWESIDRCGNVAVAQQIITFMGDDLVPVLSSSPPDITISCEELATINSNVTATDNCTQNINVILSENVITGSCPQEYELIRTWTATDNCGNSAQTS